MSHYLAILILFLRPTTSELSSMSQDKAPLRYPGDVVNQRYKIIDRIGSGSFAEVHLGLDISLDRDIAVKIMRLGLLNQPGVDGHSLRQELMNRFHREAVLVAKLRSQHVVTLFDFGAEPNGDLFMILEYVPGQTLREEVMAMGRLQPRRVAHILRQCCQGLAEAHAYELLHRDIKPENIMLFDYFEERDQVRIVDFGIAKTLQERASDLTNAGILVGTPRYMPPERVTQQPMGPASDIYSLGCVAYFLLTGEEVYKEIGPVIEILRASSSPEPIALPDYIPYKLRRIVEKMLAKNVNHRYQACRDIIAELDDFTFTQEYQIRKETGALPMLDPSFIQPITAGEDDGFVEGVAPGAYHREVPRVDLGAEDDDFSPTQVVEVDPDMFE